MSSKITNLPIELIDLIFGHLTMANDRRRTAQVCKLFNRVIRSQSMRKGDNILKLDEPLSGESQEVSPFRIFQDWESLPFSKLIISGRTWTQYIVMEPDFWAAHGHEISEMILYTDINFNEEKSLLFLLSRFFPNLKKLKIEGSWNSDIDTNVQNTLNCCLPIVELSLFSINSHEAILTILRCSPHLKKLEISVTQELLPKILPWIESVEASCLHFFNFLYYCVMPLAKLINLPSKVVFNGLKIKVDEKPEMIREFFKRPRVIEMLILERQKYNLEFNQYEDEDEHPDIIYFNRDQVRALSGAKSIKKVELPGGVLNFGGSLDLLAQLPRVESISLSLTEHRPDQLYPLYWSSPETAKKIHEITHRIDKTLDYLDGLSSLTTFSISYPDENEFDLDEFDPFDYALTSNEIQYLIRNCPNLKKLETDTIIANDADLIGIGDLLPFSSLEKLECLKIGSVPNITSEAFKSAFKFPNLKSFHLEYYSEELVNLQNAIFFTQNCPNVSQLFFEGIDTNEDAFEYFIRNLPYLRKIHVNAVNTPFDEEKLKAMKKEFPYVKLVVNV